MAQDVQTDERTSEETWSRYRVSWSIWGQVSTMNLRIPFSFADGQPFSRRRICRFQLRNRRGCRIPMAPLNNAAHKMWDTRENVESIE